MAQNHAFSCGCGALQGHVTPEGVAAGTRVVCYCADCRANELFHGQPDPAPGPVDLIQLSPDAITITQGSEHLHLLRLGPKGLFRWYAGCCGTPFANTLARPGLPFAGMRADLFAEKDALGKVRTRSFQPRPGKPPRHQGAGAMVYRMFSRMIAARLSGRWRQTPFFDENTGRPVAEPEVLSKEQRAALYPRA